MDLIIKNGIIIDGTGQEQYLADVGVKDNFIVAVGKLNEQEANIEINANGKYVMPGFIDMHQHSDITLLAGPQAESSVKQGLTTVIVGHCGHSAAPVKDKELIKSNIYGYQPKWGIDIEWASIGEYLDRIRDSNVSINVGTLVGHGAIRLAALGFADRKCNFDELVCMKKYLQESLEQGALGFSTGLEYSPGKNANLDELIELNKIVAKVGKVYNTHIRNREKFFKEALVEALTTSKKTGVKLQISHVNTRFWATGEPIKMMMELRDEAIKDGADVAYDIYPYTFAAFTLGLFVPPWAFAKGIDGVLSALKDLNSRTKMKEYTNQPLSYLAQNNLWDNLILCSSENNSELKGKNFFEIAEIRKVEPFDALLDILLEEGKNFYNILAYGITQEEDDIVEILKYPNVAVMSDSYSLSTNGVLKDTVMGPAAYSWTVFYLENYIIKRKVLSIEEGIRRITSLPAQIMNLKDRGIIAEKMKADLVIVDPVKLKTIATIQNPNMHPEGIEHVIINGMLVVKDGGYTGVRAGQVIK